MRSKLSYSIVNNYRKLVRVLAIASLITAGLYGSACLLILTQQQHLIFFPESVIEHTPADSQVAFEDVTLPIQSATGKPETIHGWWIPSDQQPTRVLLYVHGNYGNVGSNAHHAARLQRLGFSVFLFDYRGYGRSEGSFPVETQVYQDAQRAWDYLIQERHFKPEQILIYGHSLGGAIAIDLASHHPDTAGLIVESSFTSLRDMALRDPKFAIFPVDWLLTQHFNSISKVPSLAMPVLFLHGTADETIPFQMSQQLFATAPGSSPQSKRLLLISGGGHANNADIAEPLYLQTIRDFVDQT